MTLKVRSTASAGNSTSSIPFPAGALVGDLIVINVLYGYLDPADPRLVTVDTGVYYLVVTNTMARDPFIPTWTGGGFGFLLEGYQLVVYQNVRTIVPPATYNPNAQPLVLTNRPPVPPVTYSTDLPAAIAILEGISGTVTGPVNSDSTGAWTTDSAFRPNRSSGRIEHYVGPRDLAEFPPGSFPSSGTSPSANGWVLAITVTDKPPAVRQYPRDDGLGLSSAPRHYPQPKRSQRVVAGYQ